MKDEIQRIKDKLEKRQRVTEKAIKEIFDICSLLDRMKGVETIKECVVPAGWGFNNILNFPVFFGIINGELSTYRKNDYDVWVSDPYPLYEALRCKRISLKQAVSVIKIFLEKLSKVEVPEEEANKINKILEFLK